MSAMYRAILKRVKQREGQKEKQGEGTEGQRKGGRDRKQTYYDSVQSCYTVKYHTLQMV